MAGEIKSGVDGTVGIAPGERNAVEQTEGSANDYLQQTSIWQSKDVAVKKPYGEPINDLAGKSTVVSPFIKNPTGELPVFRPISEQIGVGPKKVEEPAGRIDNKNSRENLTAEEREKLIEKFGKTLEDQRRHASNEVWSTTVIGASLIATKVYAPVRIAAGAVGVISYLHDGSARRKATKDAVAVLGSLPNADAEKFGKHQQSMQLYSDITGGAYVAGAATWGVWLTGLMKSSTPMTVAGLGAMGVDLVNSAYLRPKTVSNFQTDFEAWKKQMKK
jgi:hypothetical protein